jgi:hypothetical protein
MPRCLAISSTAKGRTPSGRSDCTCATLIRKARLSSAGLMFGPTVEFIAPGNIATEVREPMGKFSSQTVRQSNWRFVLVGSQWPGFLSTRPMQKWLPGAQPAQVAERDEISLRHGHRKQRLRNLVEAPCHRMKASREPIGVSGARICRHHILQQIAARWATQRKRYPPYVVRKPRVRVTG